MTILNLSISIGNFAKLSSECETFCYRSFKLSKRFCMVYLLQKLFSSPSCNLKKKMKLVSCKRRLKMYIYEELMATGLPAA